MLQGITGGFGPLSAPLSGSNDGGLGAVIYNFLTGVHNAGETSLANAARVYTDTFLNEVQGASTFPAFTNLCPVDYASAVVGILGSGGALWTGGLYDNLRGCTLEVISKDATKTRLRLYGTPNANAQIKIGFCDTRVIPATQGAVFTFSFKLSIFRSTGATAANAWNKSFCEYSNSGVNGVWATGKLVDTKAGENILNSGTGVAELSTKITMGNASCAFVKPTITIFASLNTPIDCEFEISEVMVTSGTGKIAYSTASRTADDLTVNGANTILSSGCGVTLTFRLPNDKTSGTIFQIGTTTNGIEVKHSNYLVSVVVYVAGTPTTTVIGQALPWLRSIVSVSYALSAAVTASLNHKPAKSCGNAPASIAGLVLGFGATGYLYGAVERLKISRSAVNVQVESALSDAIYDDFDRADGPIGTAWTGQTYQVSGTAPSRDISGGAVVTTDSGGATTSAYFLIDMGAQPKIVAGACAWTSAGSHGTAGIISTPNNTSETSEATGITAESLHWLFNPQGIYAQEFLSNNLTAASITFGLVAAGTKDGVTPLFGARKKRASDGVVMATAWTGEAITFQATNYNNHDGQFMVFETFWDNPAYSRAIWEAMGAETA